MQNMNRRDFMKMTGAAAAGFALSQVLGLGKTSAQAPVVGSQYVPAGSGHGSCAKVYFTEHIDAAHLIKLYDIINESIYGKVAIKLHTGEPHGPNILHGIWSKRSRHMCRRARSLRRIHCIRVAVTRQQIIVRHSR